MVVILVFSVRNNRVPGRQTVDCGLDRHGPGRPIVPALPVRIVLTPGQAVVFITIAPTIIITITVSAIPPVPVLFPAVSIVPLFSGWEKTKVWVIKKLAVVPTMFAMTPLFMPVISGGFEKNIPGQSGKATRMYKKQTENHHTKKIARVHITSRNHI